MSRVRVLENGSDVGRHFGTLTDKLGHHVVVAQLVPRSFHQANTDGENQGF